MRLDFKCSATGSDFIVLLKKEHGDELYKVVKIVTDKTDIDTDEIATNGIVGIDVSEIDYGNIRCPWCRGGKWSFIKCGCGKLICSGGVEEYEGNYIYKCPWCGSETYVDLERPVHRIKGKIKD